VQFVRELLSGREFAVKFFVVAKAFEFERHMHATTPLHAFLPEADLYENHPWLDTAGHALPHCIVMERGESLAEWLQLEKPDLVKAVTVRRMHACI
jgi:hypothetical protein